MGALTASAGCSSPNTQMLPQFLVTKHLGDSPLFMSLDYSQKFNHSLTHMLFPLLCTSYTPIRHHLQKGPSRRYNYPFLQAVPKRLRGGSEAISYTWQIVLESKKTPGMEMQLCLRRREVNGLHCNNVKFRLQLTPGLPLAQNLSWNLTCITSSICMCECIHCRAGDGEKSRNLLLLLLKSTGVLVKTSLRIPEHREMLFAFTDSTPQDTASLAEHLPYPFISTWHWREAFPTDRAYSAQPKSTQSSS